MANTAGTVNGVDGVTPQTPSDVKETLPPEVTVTFLPHHASSDEDQQLQEHLAVRQESEEEEEEDLEAASGVYETVETEAQITRVLLSSGDPDTMNTNKQEIYMEGSLLKRHRGLGQSSAKLKSLKFKPRYCWLTPAGLEYYEKKKDRKPRGLFPMDHVKIVEIIPSHSFGRTCCFQIGDDKEQMYFACQTYQERKQWTEAFRKAALDSGNSMLSHFHWGAYGLEEKDKWSCCKSADRMSQGCHPVGTVVKYSDGNAVGYEPDAQQKMEWQDSFNDPKTQLPSILEGSTSAETEMVSETLEPKEGSFSFNEVANELQDAKSWLHLSVHMEGSPGGTVSGDSNRESLLESLQLKTPACSKMLEPLVRCGLVTVADTAGDDIAVLPTPDEISPQSGDATDLVVEEPTDQENGGNVESDEEEQQEAPPTLAELVNELQEVVDWFYLGLCLRVPIATLLNLRQDYRNVDTCRTEMLDAWMKKEKPTWSKIITALKEMKLTALAKRLASKFCVDTDKVASQQQPTSDSKLVHLDMRYVDKDDQKLPGDLVRALKEVKSWYPLGLCLGIPMEELQEIKSKRISAKKCARKVLLAWMEKEVKSWETLVWALNEVGATDLAYRIASKYNVPIAHQPGEGVPSTDSLRKPRTESVVMINAEHQSVSFRKDDDDFIPGWDFTIPEVTDHVFEDASLGQDEREERVDPKDLLSELREVTDWFYLGMCLGIPTATLQAVKKDYKHTDERKREVFLKWMEMEEPTWSKVVRVLREMGKRALANQMAQNHGLSVSDLDEPVERMAEGEWGGSSLLSEVHESKPSLKDLLRELQEVTEWQPFGRHLGLEDPELEAIYEDNQTTEDSRREMIMLWMERDPECSWKQIVNALVQMEALPLAAQIAHKYGVPLPQAVIDYVAEEQLQSTANEVQEDVPCPEGLHTQMEGVAMKDLLTELQEVTDWLYLGVCLGVSESRLKAIRCDYEDIEDRRREMLSSWMEKEIATWRKIINALAEIGMPKLAIGIASKYGEDVPPSLQEALERLERDVAEGQDIKQDDTDGTGEDDSAREPDQAEEDGSTLDPTLEEEEMIIPAYEDQGEVKLKYLVNELKDVTDWFTFGCYLDLGVAALNAVRRDRIDVDSCRREMLSLWMREHEATWYKVVAALVEMKMYHLAVKIASKYQVRVSKKMVDAMRADIPEGELRVLEVEEVEESDAESESSSDEDEEEVEMKDILQELGEVTEWHYLGLCLGVEESRLKAIRKDNKGNENRKRAMLFAWSKLKVPTWRRVVHALLEMGERVLAEKIAKKHGVPLPKHIRERPRPEEEEGQDEEEEPEHSLPKVYGFDMMDAFWNGNVIQLIAESNGYPIQVKEGKIRGYGPFSGPKSHFTVLTPRGAPRGEIMLQNVFWQGSYLAIRDRVYIATSEGLACRLRVHIGPNNLVCFEAVDAPGQYLGMSYNGAACKPKKVTPDQVEAKFFVRVQRQMYQYLTTIMTEFGRPSVANLLQDECIVQLYVRPINAFLGINKRGGFISTAGFSNSETHFKIKDNGNGIYSFISACYRGRCIRIKDNVQHGKGELSLDANFYLRENLDGTVSFESVTCPRAFISVQDGTRLLKDFSLFSVKFEYPRKNILVVTRTPLT